jgi:putative peptidoglycan lipid II flippase
MINRILTVGGFTLLSRVTGFARDIVMAAVLGAGPIADAFLVAFRLPNHFRAIFAEGAFAAAFVPAYARIRTQTGADAAKLFGDRIFTLLFASQIVLLALALAFTPGVIWLLAPGFRLDPVRFDLAVDLTRITFPYLLLMTLVTLFSGVLNAVERFAAAAAAPILLNLTMMVALLLAAFFPTAGHAAAWGVLIAGLFEVLLVGGDALRNDVLTALRWPRFDTDVKRFFKALVPATVGSAGIQLALFADTMIGSVLAAGALSALYYADRLYQLPGGVIGIAVGTVLLPEMARRIAAGDEDGARAAQGRAIQFTLLLAVPCVAAFLVVPDLIMRALFMRGKFTADDAHAAAMTLAAYSIGLLPFVLMRSVVAMFLARGDTTRPVKAALAAAGVNIAFKVAFLYLTALAQVGLALATSFGAWINFVLVVWLGARAGLMRADNDLVRAVGKLAVAGLILTTALWLAEKFATARMPDVVALIALALLGAAVYAAAILALFGKAWLVALWRGADATSASAPPERE